MKKNTRCFYPAFKKTDTEWNSIAKYVCYDFERDKETESERENIKCVKSK